MDRVKIIVGEEGWRGHPGPKPVALLTSPLYTLHCPTQNPTPPPKGSGFENAPPPWGANFLKRSLSPTHPKSRLHLRTVSINVPANERMLFPMGEEEKSSLGGRIDGPPCQVMFKWGEGEGAGRYGKAWRGVWSTLPHHPGGFGIPARPQESGRRMCSDMPSERPHGSGLIP